MCDGVAHHEEVAARTTPRDRAPRAPRRPGRPATREDACAAASYLAASGRADAARLAIDGGSAGGFTTLGALAFKDIFAAGCSLYGVADCSALAADTHKFESRYLDGLIGPYVRFCFLTLSSVTVMS